MITLEDKISIARWCGWVQGKDPFNKDIWQDNKGLVYAKDNMLFERSSHFEALRQVLRQKDYGFRQSRAHRYWETIEGKSWGWEELLWIFKPHENYRDGESMVIVGSSYIDVDQDENVAWLDAVKDVIAAEIKASPITVDNWREKLRIAKAEVEE